jgi:hypothetical protein
MVREFSKVIQLPVLFLEKGSYTYTVNDDLSGTFELPSDKKILFFHCTIYGHIKMLPF